MRNELIKGYKLIFPEKKEGYIIKDVLGRGASCLVYLTEINEGNNVRYSIIKEFNPVKLDLKRDASGTLIIPDEKSGEYSILLERFKHGYEKQQQIRIINDLTNTTSNIQGIYHTNNTEYIEMTYFNGETYSFNSEKSLYNFFRRMKALTQVISNYHNAGFLHLDIKPDNVYVLPETPEMVMLFDFDSVIEKDAVVGNSSLSYTKDWASIEQIDLKRRKEICEATDLFAVGEMIFYYFFGRHSDISERRSFSKYSFDYNTDQFDGANPLIIKHLSELLHNTICNIVKNRYQTAQELIDKLDILISLSNPNEPFLKTNIPSATGFFVGRDDELDLLHDKIQDTNVLFVSGVGGIGKSELVKHYAKKHVNDYDAIIFAPFVSDVFTLITDDVSLPIANFKNFPDEKIEEYYTRKLCKLKELCNDKVLIIIDNFDNEEELEKLFALNCKLLFTTRCDFYDVHEQIDLSALKDRRYINDIFYNFYLKPMTAEDSRIVNEIIDIVEGHTMTVELLAKQMMVGRIKPQDMLERLISGGIYETGQEEVRSSKNEKVTGRNTFNHIKALFDLSELGESETEILANLSLIPHTGIPTELFYEWCNLNSYDLINSLVTQGWIRCDKSSDYISLHPVVADVVKYSDKINTAFEFAILQNSVKSTKEKIDSLSFEDKRIRINILLQIIDNLVNHYANWSSVAFFLFDVSYLVYSYGYLDEALVAVEKARLIIEHDEQCSGYELYELYSTLGYLCYEKNELDKSENWYFKAFDVLKKHNREKNMEAVALYEFLADLYELKGEFRKSTDYFKKALSIILLPHNKKKMSKEEVYERLGNMYYNLEDFKKSEIYYIKFLKNVSNKGEKNLVEIAKAHKHLSYLYKIINDYNRAMFHCEESLKLYEHCDGQMDSVISLYNLLGDILYSCEQYSNAEEVYEETLKKAVNFYGDRNLEVADCSNNLAKVYKSMGKYKEAEKYLWAELDILCDIYGEIHSDVAKKYYEIAVIYHKQNNFDFAINALMKSLETAAEVYGADSIFVGNLHAELAELYFEMENYKIALLNYEHARDIWTKAEEGDEENIEYVLEQIDKLNEIVRL